MRTVDYGDDPTAVEEQQIARRRQLAELMMSQSMGSQPVYSNKAAVAKALMGMLAQRDLGAAEKEQTALAQKREATRTADYDKLFEFANQKPTVGPGQVQKDDDGNDMPGNVVQTQEKRQELARTMLGSRTKGISEFALQQLVGKPKDDEPFTLKPGEKRFKSGQVVAEVPEHVKPEKPEGPKKGELRKIMKGGEEIQQEWSGTGWDEVGRGSRWAPREPMVDPLVEVVDPKNPKRTIMIPRSQASGQSGPGSLTRDRADREDADGMRKEFNTLPAVKAYTTVKPIIESARKAADTPQGDLALVYGVGKALDPDSVVREGEMTMVMAAGSPAQRIMGHLSVLRGGGRLTPAVRKELVSMLDQRASEYEKAYQGARQTYEGIAKQRGYDPGQIFLNTGFGAPQPATPDDYAKLPKGSKYIAPDGTERVKG